MLHTLDQGIISDGIKHIGALIDLVYSDESLTKHHESLRVAVSSARTATTKAAARRVLNAFEDKFEFNETTSALVFHSRR